MSIPERERRSSSERTHDGSPLRGRSVDSEMNAERLSSLDHRVEESAVGGLVRPVLSSLNVKPEHTNVGTSRAQVVDGSLNLASSVSAARAGEDVSIDVGHASSPGAKQKEEKGSN